MEIYQGILFTLPFPKIDEKLKLGEFKKDQNTFPNKSGNPKGLKKQFYWL